MFDVDWHAVLFMMIGLQVVLDTGLETELFVNLSAPLSNVSFRVCAYTGAGPGPWTPLQTITLIPAGVTVTTSKIPTGQNCVLMLSFLAMFYRNGAIQR